MNRFLKYIVLAVIALLVVAGVAITYITQALPNITAPDLKVEITPERVARGAYLANSVCVCMDCHSTRDWNKFSGPVVKGDMGMGGERFDPSFGFPGTFISKNITPFGLGTWTDGEIYRAITSGVSKDGHPLFPVMPYPNYGKMADEDIHSIIAYLRSLPAVESTPAASKAEFPMSVIMHTIPQAAGPVPRPDPSDALAYGDYLTNAAGCGECHTRAEHGKKVGAPFAGGFEFAFPSGAVVRSANITPSRTGGIGAWTRADFIERFKAYADSSYTDPTVDMAAQEFQTVMPWKMYAHMSEQDLSAIYDHLRTVPAVDATVERWTAK